jgi:hypothetical protein
VLRGRRQRHRPLRGVDSSVVGLDDAAAVVVVVVVVVVATSAYDSPCLILEQAFPSSMDAASDFWFLR